MSNDPMQQLQGNEKKGGYMKRKAMVMATFDQLVYRISITFTRQIF
jgi:hypothetical protein